jgi:hypothetical protein
MAQQQQGQEQQQQQQAEADPNDPSDGQDLDSAMAQLGQSLSKSEQGLPSARKELLKRHKAAKAKIMKEFGQESKVMIESIMNAVGKKKE